MHDLPTGSQLLGSARAVVLEELMPLLPRERRCAALLVADCLAIAAREATAPAAPALVIDAGLRRLYGLQSSGSAMQAARSPGVVGGAAQAGACDPALWRRFAADLRLGAFAHSPDREVQARTVLWHMTIARLRLANPSFLAANGFAGGDRPGDQNYVR
jgi:hypothetical protein